MAHIFYISILSPIGWFFFGITQSAPPDLTGIAAIITAGVGAIGFIATLIRGRRNNRRVEEVEQAASYIKGFDALIKRLQEEIDEMRREQGKERRLWAKEKEQHMAAIRTLRGELQEAIATHSATKGQLSELKGQIRGFLNAKEFEEFQKHIS